MTLLSHSTADYQRARPAGRRRGANAARARCDPITSQLFMSTLTVIATPRRHTNVLMHMAGHLKKLLDGSVQAGTGGDHRRIPSRSGSAGRSAHAAAPPRAAPRCLVPSGPDLSRTKSRELMLKTGCKQKHTLQRGNHHRRSGSEAKNRGSPLLRKLEKGSGERGSHPPPNGAEGGATIAPRGGGKPGGKGEPASTAQPGERVLERTGPTRSGV